MSTRPKLDFQAIKDAASLEAVMRLLQLPTKKSGAQWRCECPVHPGANRTLAITPDKGFYCHQSHQGGDQIGLYAHVREVSNYDAAAALGAHFKIPAEASAEQRQAAPISAHHAMKPLDYLSTDHPALALLGLTEETCAALGIGFANRGVMNGRIVFPLRLADGKLCGYLGLATKAEQTPLVKVPSDLAEKCGAGERVEEPVEPPKSKDELRKLLRVV